MQTMEEAIFETLDAVAALRDRVARVVRLNPNTVRVYIQDRLSFKTYGMIGIQFRATGIRYELGETEVGVQSPELAYTDVNGAYEFVGFLAHALNGDADGK